MGTTDMSFGFLEQRSPMGFQISIQTTLALKNHGNSRSANKRLGERKESWFRAAYSI